MAATGVAGLFFIAGLTVSEALEPFTFAMAVLFAGGSVIVRAFKNLANGRALDEHFLMTAAVAGAFALHQYSEGAAVMLFYRIGEMFQSYAVRRSRRSVAALTAIRPEYACVRRNGEFVKVPPEDVAKGEFIRVTAGERIPLDGTVVEGSASLDTSALTGESLPRLVSGGDGVSSGCINLNAPLIIQTASVYRESTVARILELVENAAARKAPLENFITRFARVYTPLVVGSAVLLASVPPLFFAQAFDEWLYRALTFLVVSCPCALVISVPLGFFAGIGAASRNGILVKGSAALEVLSRVDTAVFDKTGTLTFGRFKVVEVFDARGRESEVLEMAAHADALSRHPVALSIVEAFGGQIDFSRVKHQREIAGKGVTAEIDGHRVAAGTAALMAEEGIGGVLQNHSGTTVYVAVDGKYAGGISVAAELKPDAAEGIARLRKSGVRKVVILSGDDQRAAQSAAAAVGADEVYAELTPVQKVERLEELDAEKRKGRSLIFVGDGINDAPVLARADAGIAMGGVGSDAAIEAADVVLMTDEPSKVADGVSIAAKTLKIVRENIVFALGIKGGVLMMGAFGAATMWEAVFADVGVSVLAVLNAMRALSYKRARK